MGGRREGHGAHLAPAPGLELRRGVAPGSPLAGLWGLDPQGWSGASASVCPSGLSP